MPMLPATPRRGFSLSQVITIITLVAGLVASFATTKATGDSNALRIERLEKKVQSLRERLAADDEKIKDMAADISELQR